MGQYLLYLAFAAFGIGYLFMVIYCLWDGVSSKWWEPWVMPLVLPFYLLYEHRMSIVGTATLVVAIGAVLWMFVLVGDLFRWIWSLV